MSSIENYQARRSFTACRFLVSLVLTSNLSLNVLITSLRLFNKSYSAFNESAIKEKLHCCACVLLSWAIWEDFETSQTTDKPSVIIDAYYSLSIGFSDNDDKREFKKQLESDFFKLERNRIFSEIICYEHFILHMNNYCILEKDDINALKDLASYLTILASSLIGNLELYAKAYNIATAFIIDFLHLQESAKYTITDIVKAAAFKSTCFNELHICSSVANLSDEQLSIITPYVSAVLELMRRMYS